MIPSQPPSRNGNCLENLEELYFQSDPLALFLFVNIHSERAPVPSALMSGISERGGRPHSRGVRRMGKFCISLGGRLHVLVDPPLFRPHGKTVVWYDLACCNSWGRKEPDTAEQLN